MNKKYFSILSLAICMLCSTLFGMRRMQKEHGHTDLTWAIYEKNNQEVKRLLEQENTDPNEPDTTHYTMTPLSWAIDNNNIKAAKLLLTHPNIDPNKPNPKNKGRLNCGDRTPITSAIAIQRRSTAILRLLLKHKDIQLNPDDLSTAIGFQHLRALWILLQYINPNQMLKEGNTPLIYAIVTGHKYAVQVLLAANADPNKCDSKKRTPLERTREISKYSTKDIQPDIIKMLIFAGARITKKTIKFVSQLISSEAIKQDIQQLANYGSRDYRNKLLLYRLWNAVKWRHTKAITLAQVLSKAVKIQIPAILFNEPFKAFLKKFIKSLPQDSQTQNALEQLKKEEGEEQERAEYAREEAPGNIITIQATNTTLQIPQLLIFK